MIWANFDKIFVGKNYFSDKTWSQKKILPTNLSFQQTFCRKIGFLR